MSNLLSAEIKGTTAKQVSQRNSTVARDRLRFEHHLLNLNSRLSRTVNK